MHCSAFLENSTLRRSSCPRVKFPSTSIEYPWLFDAIGCFTDEELVETVDVRFMAVGFDFATILSSFCSCILFAIVFWAASQAEILSEAKRAEMADVEQMKKMVPIVTCEIAFGQHVCALMSGIDLSNLNFRIKINPVKQPI